MLERLQLTGALVTIDAMGTQTDIAERIITGGGDYLLALKANRPVLHQDVVDFFAHPPTEMTEPGHNTTDGDHGRIEERRHVVCHKVNWLFSDRRYADEPRFPHLAMIGLVKAASTKRPPRARTPILSLLSQARRQDLRRRRASPLERQTGSIGCSTSSSTMTSPTCEPLTALKTWLSSNT